MQPSLQTYDRSGPWLILPCLVWPNITERTDVISCLRGHMPQSPCSVPESLFGTKSILRKKVPKVGSWREEAKTEGFVP